MSMQHPALLHAQAPWQTYALLSLTYSFSHRQLQALERGPAGAVWANWYSLTLTIASPRNLITLTGHIPSLLQPENKIKGLSRVVCVRVRESENWRQRQRDSDWWIGSLLSVLFHHCPLFHLRFSPPSIISSICSSLKCSILFITINNMARQKSEW